MQDFLFDVLCKTLRGNRGTLRLIMPVKEILEMETASCSDMLESQDCCLFVWWKNKVLGFIIFSGNSSVPRSACAWLLTYGYNKRTACQQHLHKITLSWSDPFHISTTAIYISCGECFWQQIKSLSKGISCLLDLCQHSFLSILMRHFVGTRHMFTNTSDLIPPTSNAKRSWRRNPLGSVATQAKLWLTPTPTPPAHGCGSHPLNHKGTERKKKSPQEKK